jgi:hypothetical protein
MTRLMSSGDMGKMMSAAAAFGPRANDCLRLLPAFRRQ